MRNVGSLDRADKSERTAGRPARTDKGFGLGHKDFQSTKVGTRSAALPTGPSST